MKRYNITTQSLNEQLHEIRKSLERFPEVNSYRNPKRETEFPQLASDTHDLVLEMGKLLAGFELEEAEDGEWVKYKETHGIQKERKGE